MKKLFFVAMLTGLVSTTLLARHHFPNHHPQRPRIVCKTKNFEGRFRAQGRIRRKVRRKVIRRCVRNSYTRRGAKMCRRNVRCHRF